MQLIQITEPPSIDIKKTMSTLGEAFESNQMNGDIADIGGDVCAKITTNLNDNVSKSVEDITEESATKEQVEIKLKDLNGFVKTNGDAQKENLTPALDNIENNKKESENNVVLQNGSGASGKSNESSSITEPCESPASTAADIISTVDENIILEKKDSSIDLNEKVEAEEKKNTSDLNTTNVSLNNKDVVGVDSVEIPSAVVENQADVCSEQVSDADKLKHIGNAVENKDMIQTISAFSPNSDTNEKEINISAQLQQLEDDVSMEEVLSNSFIDAQISTDNKSSTLEMEMEVPELNKPSSPVQKQKNEIQSLMVEQQKNKDLDIIEDASQKSKDLVESHNQEVDTQGNSASEIHTENPSVLEDKCDDRNNVFEKGLETAHTDDKPENSSENLLDRTPSKGMLTELNQGINETTVISNKNEEVSCVAIEKPSVKNDEKQCKKVMNVDAREQVQEQYQESSNNVDPGVDNNSQVQKYITVKKFTDMTYPVACENNKSTEVSDDKKQVDEEQLNEVMEVDVIDSIVTPDNNVSLGTSDKPLEEKETEVENNIEMADEETANDITENSKSSMGPEETQQPPIDQKKNNSDVMEIDDVDEISVVEKPGAGATVDKSEVHNTAVEVNSCEKLIKQDAVINITDNDDEEIKSCAPEHTKAKEDEASQVISIDDNVKNAVAEVSNKTSSGVDIKDSDSIEEKKEENISEKSVVKQLPVVCKLSNTMDILSDEEDELLFEKTSEEKKIDNEKSKEEEQNKCINLDDDDDIMFIEDTNSQGPKNEENKSEQPSDNAESQTTKTTDNKIYPDTVDNNINTSKNDVDESLKTNEKDDSIPIEMVSQTKEEEPKPFEPTEIKDAKEPLITKSFLKSVTKNLADMTRNELEDFCILKLVESVVDKSNLNEIKIKMKTMAQSVEELRKKALALTKQNRDLQVVVKTVQEDQKKRNPNPMMPMKITRSVGMQVVLSGGEKSILKKKLSTPAQPPLITPARPVRNIQSPKIQKPAANNIPVPRLVPASSPTIKSPATPVNNAIKPTTIVKNTTPQRSEKRPHSKLTSPASSVTVDLTDDEPPAKITTKNPTPPVRLVPSQNLMAPKTRPQFGPTGNSPRKVYIPISTHNQNIRPNSAVIKNFVSTPPRPRQPSVVRMQTVRLNQAPSVNRHPAPLPDAMKQYQPPTWKALPPAPDLKLSKVDNGIVISWKFEGYQPDTYEEVASFQLYAYQETPAPPSTALWKKIGDIKALPLPMACTLTQFMSGFKYYFAVRAIDVRSRIGPFSLPGSIMLISKS